MAKWLLIDGFNLAYRCFFAIPELNRADGFPTNALHGWVKSIWRMQDEEKPDATLVFFDLGGAQDRLALHPEYKAQREEMPEALQRQIPVIKELTRAMGLVGVEQEGVESDDLLASKAVAVARTGGEAVIASSDKDFAQIVGDRIWILLPPPSANPKIGWRRMNAAGVVEKFGVPPARIAEYLALVGDTSDNIPGLEGVGPKTAAKWLDRFGSLEDIIAHAGEVEPVRFRAPIAEAADRLRLNLKLTTLNLALSVGDAAAGSLDFAGFCRLLSEYGMKSTLAEAERRYGQPEFSLE